jgi:hypothetical protein
MQKAAWIALCVFLGGSCSLVAAPDVAFFGRTVNPLLYVVSAESFDFGEHWAKRQTYIFRDGTVLSTLLNENVHSRLPAGGQVFSGKVSAEQMRLLVLAVAEVKVGLQQDCTIDPPDSPLEWHFQFSWFGAGKRKNTFKATEDGPGLPCPPATEALIDAVTGTVNAAYQARTTALAVP